MITLFDPLLICIALLTMLAGMGKRRALWKVGRHENVSGSWAVLVPYLLNHAKILKRPPAGVAHLFLFWGFLFFLLIVIFGQFSLLLPPRPAQVVSLVMDLLGVAMLLGTAGFLVRRLRPQEVNPPRRVLLPLATLIVILVTGFLAEGARLAILPPTSFWASPIGWSVSLALPQSPFLMQLMIRVHFFAVLFFIATIPFSSMRHLVAAPLNIFYRSLKPRGELLPVSLEHGPLGATTVRDFSWKELLDAEACVSCKRCDENCPAFLSGKPLSPRNVIQKVLRQMEEGSLRAPASTPLLAETITAEEIWSCTTCMACVEHCPVLINPMEKIVAVRRSQVLTRGEVPAEARPMIRNLEIYGDTQGNGIAYRGDWVFSRDVPILPSGHWAGEVLLWVGCSGAFHPDYQEVARAMAKILTAGQVRFGILGPQELCCGDPARRMGEEALFLDLARKNINRLQHYHITRIVALCPHCFNTLRNEYPGLGGHFEVVHAVEFILSLLEQKRIALKYALSGKTAIHDPCYLGRVNQIYEPLRRIVRAIPEIECTELGRTREKGFCCGGGGGSMWLHENLGSRINQLRAQEISEAKVERVVTACPYCLTMLQDGVNSLGVQRPPKVSDIVTMVASSIG